MAVAAIQSALEQRTVADRAAHGRAARADAPRSSHADWVPAAGRFDPVDLLQEQAAARVPELVPIRYGRMLASPFTFFRGAAYIMAADLAETPTSGLEAQLCGDAHLSNFGAFASAERELIFDINDFDETLPGPWEWDLKRLAASIAVAGRDRGFDRRLRGRMVRAASGEYRTAMRRFSGMSLIDVWYARTDARRLAPLVRARLSARGARGLKRAAARAGAKDSRRAVDKLARVVEGELRIVSDPPLIVPIADLLPSAEAEGLADRMAALIDAYRETLPRDRRRLLDGYRFVDLARKVVGVGSVGTRAWIMLMVGRDGGDPLFLQCKEADRSVLEAFTEKSEFDCEGERVVEGQRLMQASSDVLLGWLATEGLDGQPRDFYIRQLWDWKRSADLDSMTPALMSEYGRLCGWTLARAHARSGDRVAIAAYLGKGDVFDCALAEFAERYADQSERDYAALAEAAANGRVEVRTDL